MKKFSLLLFLVLSATLLDAQKWEQIIGQPNQNETSRRIIEHYDKGYILSAQLEQHGWLLKTDINGNVLWDKELGVDPDIVITEKTLFDTEGNLYLFGLLKQDLPNEWPVVIKLDACGEKQWCKLQYHNDHEFGYLTDAILLDNGDLLALANMPTADQFEMIYLFCISPDGEYKWKRPYASRADHPLFDARYASRIQKFDDIYIISGYVYSPHPNYPTIVSIRPMFIGIDTMFAEQWVLEFGLEDNMKGKAVETIAINDSLFMGVGRYRYDNTKDAWAMIYNNNGEQVGQQVFTNDMFNNEVSESTFYEIEKVNDSIFIATAGFYSIELDGYSKGEVIFDTSGNVYSYCIRLESSSGSYITKTFDNKYVIATSYLYPDLTWDIYFYKINDSLGHDTVYPGTYNYDSLCTSLPIQSGVIDLTGCDIVTSLEEIPTLEDYNNRKNKIIISAFPNPAHEGSVTLGFKNIEYFEDMEFKCFDVFGKEVYSEKVYPYQGESILQVSNWNKGVFITIIYSNGIAIGQVKFVVQ